MDRTDGQLLAACRAGDRSAWELLVHRHSRRLWAIARVNGLDSATAADVVQTGWRNLLESLDRIKEPEAVGGWLATVVKREAVRASKAQRRPPPATLWPPDLPPPDEQVLDGERAATVRAALTQLSASCQQLLRLLFSDSELSYAEVAEILDRPIGSIGPSRARCLQTLRGLLEQATLYQSGAGGL